MDFVTHLFSIKLFTNQDMSVNATSPVQNIDNVSCYAVQYIWTGFTGVSSVIFEASNDGINFSQIDTFLIPDAADNRIVNVEKAGYSFVRCRNAQSTATGSLTVIINGKII